MSRNNISLIVITGPTATGKTTLAARVAAHVQGEVISADSRQVYRGMDLGTGKDLDDYVVDGRQIPYHLIDIADPGDEYNVYVFQEDFFKVYEDILKRKKQAILCGGTGLYIEAVLERYRLLKVPENPVLRKQLNTMSMEQMERMLSGMKRLHNITDTTHRERLTRAIEIAHYEQNHPDHHREYPELNPIIFAPLFERSELRRRITARLEERLNKGMVGEVERLLSSGLDPGQLVFYGLEYRYLTMYVCGDISYNEMFKRLNTAIHQFAKRQMTWFRRMEKKGVAIHWIDGRLPVEEKVNTIISRL